MENTAKTFEATHERSDADAVYEVALQMLSKCEYPGQLAFDFWQITDARVGIRLANGEIKHAGEVAQEILRFQYDLSDLLKTIDTLRADGELFPVTHHDIDAIFSQYAFSLYPKGLSEYLRSLAHELLAHKYIQMKRACIEYAQTPGQFHRFVDLAREERFIDTQSATVYSRQLRLAQLLLNREYTERPDCDPEEAIKEVMQDIGEDTIPQDFGIRIGFEQVLYNRAVGLIANRDPKQYIGLVELSQEEIEQKKNEKYVATSSQSEGVTRRQLLQYGALGATYIAIPVYTFEYAKYQSEQKQLQESFTETSQLFRDWIADNEQQYGGQYYQRTPAEQSAFKAAFLNEFHTNVSEFGTDLEQYFEIANETGQLAEAYTLLAPLSCHGLVYAYAETIGGVSQLDENLYISKEFLKKRYTMSTQDYLPRSADVVYEDINPLGWRIYHPEGTYNSDTKTKEDALRETSALFQTYETVSPYAEVARVMLDNDEYRAIFQAAPGYTFAHVLSRIKTAVHRYGSDPVPSVQKMQELVNQDIALRSTPILSPGTEKFVYFNDIEDEYQYAHLPDSVAMIAGFEGEIQKYFDGKRFGQREVGHSGVAMINELADDKETCAWILMHGSPTSLEMTVEDEKKVLEMEDTVLAAIIGRLLITRKVDTLSRLTIVTESCFAHNYMNELMARLGQKIVSLDFDFELSDEERECMLQCSRSIAEGTFYYPNIVISSQRNSWGLTNRLPHTVERYGQAIAKHGQLDYEMLAYMESELYGDMLDVSVLLGNSGQEV